MCRSQKPNRTINSLGDIVSHFQKSHRILSRSYRKNITSIFFVALSGEKERMSPTNYPVSAFCFYDAVSLCEKHVAVWRISSYRHRHCPTFQPVYSIERVRSRRLHCSGRNVNPVRNFRILIREINNEISLPCCSSPHLQHKSRKQRYLQKRDLSDANVLVLIPNRVENFFQASIPHWR